MFERFTQTARQIVVQAQEDARRLGHGYIGPEHLLLAVASTSESAGDVLRGHGVTPDRVEAELLRIVGRPADLLGDLDREALASIGIDLDAVRGRIEAAFGRDALSRPRPGACRRGRPTWAKGPVAELMRRRRRRRARRHAPPSAGPAPFARFPPGRARLRPRRPAATSRSRRGPRKAWNARCARRGSCTTTTSASSTSRWRCSPRTRGWCRSSCPASARHGRRCAPPSSTVTARRADPHQPHHASHGTATTQT